MATKDSLVNAAMMFHIYGLWPHRLLFVLHFGLTGVSAHLLTTGDPFKILMKRLESSDRWMQDHSLLI